LALLIGEPIERLVDGEIAGRQRVAKIAVNRKGISFTRRQQPMNRITLPPRTASGPRHALIRCSRRLGTIFLTCWMSRVGPKLQSIVCAGRCRPPRTTPTRFALLLQRNNRHAEAAEGWRRYLANDAQSEWAARARRSLKFCEMQVHTSLLHTMK